MSWDEADWAYTIFKGIPNRLKKLFWNEPNIEGIENGCVQIYERSKNVCHLSEEGLHELEYIAIIFGISIEYQYLDYYKYYFDYRGKEPNAEKINEYIAEEIENNKTIIYQLKYL